MLKPLTEMTPNKRKSVWTKVKQDAFKKIKRIVAHNTLSTSPYFNETLRIHTYASAFQFGAVVI